MEEIRRGAGQTYSDVRGCRQVRFSVPGTTSLPLLAEVNDRLVPAILAAAGLHWFS